MRLSSSFKSQLVDSLLATVAETDIKDFFIRHHEIIGAPYGHIISRGDTYPEHIKSIVEFVDKAGTWLYFIRLLREDFPQAPAIQSFYEEQFCKMFKDEADAIAFNPDFLDCIFVKHHLPFINRNTLKFQLGQMLEEKTSPLLFLEGEGKTGISYVRWYLSDMAQKSGQFQLEYIDMKYILNHVLQNRSRISAAHLAEYLNDQLNAGIEIDASSQKVFKVVSFLSSLRQHLRSSNTPVMLFFDHLDNMMEPDALDFIHQLVNQSMMQNLPCYIILSGVKDLSMWEKEIITILMNRKNRIQFQSFTKSDVENFFSKVYSYLTVVYGLNTSQAEFVENILKQINFNKIPLPNVSVIGRAAGNWYQEFQNNNSGV